MKRQTLDLIVPYEKGMNKLFKQVLFKSFIKEAHST